LPEQKTGREQALEVMQDYKDEKMSFYSCLERLGDIESDEFFDDSNLDEEDEDEDEDEEDNVLGDGEAGSASNVLLVVAGLVIAFLMLGLIGAAAEKNEHKLTCHPATKQVDGSFASNCDSYGEYYDSGAP
jgi:hypothetical protein